MKLLERTWPLALKVAVPLLAVSVAAATLLAVIMTAAARESFAQTYAAQALGLAQLVGTGSAKDPPERGAISTLLTDVWASVPAVRRIHIYLPDGDTAVLWTFMYSKEYSQTLVKSFNYPLRNDVASANGESLKDLKWYRNDPSRLADGIPQAVEVWRRLLGA